MSSESSNNDNVVEFRTQKIDAKSPLQLLIAHIAREVNRQKLDYEKLKQVFANVRERCDVQVPTKPKRLFELPSDAEISAFFGVIKDPIHRLIFEFLVGTGCRISEACSLEVSRLDLTKNQIFISQGKGKKDRVTIIGNKLAQKLALYLQGSKNRYLFESNRGTRFTTRRIEQICKAYKDAAGITKKFSPHVLRHVWNTSLAAQGLSEERRAILAGHEQDSGIQKVYTHLSAGGFRDEVIAMLDKIIT